MHADRPQLRRSRHLVLPFHARRVSGRPWRDHRGNVIKTQDPGGLVTKNVFDGANRLTDTFSTDGGGDSSWADAFNVTGDIVLSQMAQQLDGNGNPIFSTNAARLPDATGTGALTGSTSRISYAASYYDAADRLTAGK